MNNQSRNLVMVWILYDFSYVSLWNKRLDIQKSLTKCLWNTSIHMNFFRKSNMKSTLLEILSSNSSIFLHCIKMFYSNISCNLNSCRIPTDEQIKSYILITCVPKGGVNIQDYKEASFTPNYLLLSIL